MESSVAQHHRYVCLFVCLETYKSHDIGSVLVGPRFFCATCAYRPHPPHLPMYDIIIGTAHGNVNWILALECVQPREDTDGVHRLWGGSVLVGTTLSLISHQWPFACALVRRLMGTERPISVVGVATKNSPPKQGVLRTYTRRVLCAFPSGV